MTVAGGLHTRQREEEGSLPPSAPLRLPPLKATVVPPNNALISTSGSCIFYSKMQTLLLLWVQEYSFLICIHSEFFLKKVSSIPQHSNQTIRKFSSSQNKMKSSFGHLTEGKGDLLSGYLWARLGLRKIQGFPGPCYILDIFILVSHPMFQMQMRPQQNVWGNKFSLLR